MNSKLKLIPIFNKKKLKNNKRNHQSNYKIKKIL